MSKDVKVLEKVASLVRLANGAPDTEEARTAAVQAMQLMKEHELVLVPKSELERVQKVVEGANALARQVKEEGTQKMVLGAMAGLFLGKSLKL